MTGPRKPPQGTRDHRRADHHSVGIHFAPPGTTCEGRMPLWEEPREEPTAPLWVDPEPSPRNMNWDDVAVALLAGMLAGTVVGFVVVWILR